jgi:glycolate oxidase
MSLSRVREELRRICGSEHVLVHPHALRTYESDGLLHHRVSPAVAVLPGSAEEVRRVVLACHDAGVPWVARGSGTGAVRRRSAHLRRAC